MKKILYLTIIALILLSCTQHTKSNSDKLSIVTTIFPPYDFAKEIVGNLAQVTMLLPPAAESHSFEPTPQDIIRLRNSDVFIYTGGESDEWVDKVLASMDTSTKKIVKMIDCVETVIEEILPGMEADEEEEEEPEIDEHVFTSPRNAKLIVQSICNAICEADTANAETYQQNTKSYLERLDELDTKFRVLASSATRKHIVFGDRFPFRYLTDAYGLTYSAAFPGCSTETEASAKTIKFLIDIVNAQKIPVVFHIELSNMKMADTIAETTGAKVLLLHSCHNITKTDFDAGKSYLELMNENVNALREALL